MYIEAGEHKKAMDICKTLGDEEVILAVEMYVMANQHDRARKVLAGLSNDDLVKAGSHFSKEYKYEVAAFILSE